MGCNLCAWACPYGARELDRESGTMKKCTLCVDRIYDETLPAAERQPACVLACPTHARFFGDFDDPHSSVSRVTAERGGFGLLPRARLSRLVNSLSAAARAETADLTSRPTRAHARAAMAFARLASARSTPRDASPRGESVHAAMRPALSVVFFTVALGRRPRG